MIVKKTITASCIYLLLCTVSFGQALFYGQNFKLSNKDYLEGLVYADSNAAFLLRHKYNALGEKTSFLDKIYGDHLDQRLTTTLVWKNAHLSSPAKNKLYFESLVAFNDKMVLLTSSYDHDKNLNHAYAKYLDNDGYPDGSMYEIGQISAERKSNRGEFKFAVSPGGQYLMVYMTGPISRNDSEKFSIAVIDTSLQLVWKNDITLPYKDKEFIIHGLSLDDRGNAYMISRVYLNRSMMMNQGYEKAEYFYTMLFFRPDDEPMKYTEKTLKVEDKYLINLGARLEPDGHILVSGCFAKDNSYDPKGIYFLKIKPDTWETEKISLHEFPEEYIPDFETDLPFRFGEDGIPNIEISHFIATPDGGSLIVMEHTLISEYCYTDFRTALTTCNYSYFYNDLFIFKLNREGEIDWKLKIPKKQVSRNDYGSYSSFACSITPAGIFLFYNDSEKNTALSDARKFHFMNDVKRAALISVFINWEGKVDKRELTLNNDHKTWMRPRMYYQVGPKLFSFSSKRNQYAITRFDIAEMPR